MSGCNELMEVVVTLTGPPIWGNSRSGAGRDPAQDCHAHLVLPTQGTRPGEYVRGGPHDFNLVDGEHTIGRPPRVEPQSSTNDDGGAGSPPTPSGQGNVLKTFASAAGGAFVGRVLGDLVSKAAQKLLPWLTG